MKKILVCIILLVAFICLAICDSSRKKPCFGDRWAGGGCCAGHCNGGDGDGGDGDGGDGSGPVGSGQGPCAAGYYPDGNGCCPELISGKGYFYRDGQGCYPDSNGRYADTNGCYPDADGNYASGSCPTGRLCVVSCIDY